MTDYIVHFTQLRHGQFHITARHEEHAVELLRDYVRDDPGAVHDLIVDDGDIEIDEIEWSP